MLPLVLCGCDHEGRFPTAVSPPASHVAPNGVGDRGIPGGIGDSDRRRSSRRAVIAEAKEALGAVITGEQTYFQRFNTFTDVADIADFRFRLGVNLSEPSHRWAFSVSGASMTGFIATAQGRNDTVAEGIIVTLRYVRGQPPMWKVARRPKRG